MTNDQLDSSKGPGSTNDADRYGTLHTLADGRTQVRFVRNLPFTVDRVWASITDPAERDHWFPGVKMDARPGGTFEIWFGGECEGPAHVTGTIGVCAPPHVLECGSMRFELRATDGGCRLVFTDILYFTGPRTQAEIADSVLSGWHAYLDGLEMALHGGSSDPHRAEEPDYSAREVAGRELLS